MTAAQALSKCLISLVPFSVYSHPRELLLFCLQVILGSGVIMV
uniref:Uncharacterized protein n=1 Tax=Rhizophora mucronata TaxID=61149 RepID=A0A2P2PVW6_RHIMU